MQNIVVTETSIVVVREAIAPSIIVLKETVLAVVKVTTDSVFF